MVGAILKATDSSFQKGMTFCRSIYVKKVMKLLAFIFEQSSYCKNSPELFYLLYLRMELSGHLNKTVKNTNAKLV